MSEILNLGGLKAKIEAKKAEDEEQLRKKREEVMRSFENDLTQLSRAKLESADNVFIDSLNRLKKCVDVEIERAERFTEANNRQEAISRRLMKSWFLPIVTAALICVAIFAVGWAWIAYLKADIRDLRSERAALEAEMTKLDRWGITTMENKDGRFIIVPRKMTLMGGWTTDNGRKEVYRLERT